MKLEVLRYNSQSDYTDGLLFIDGKFECFTLEDEYRANKVYGETRIPDGEYEITLRTVGGFHGRYSNKFPDMHEGMLWVRNVPGFEYILIHIGNDDEDTAGCLLVGMMTNADKKGFIGSSTVAYKKMYPKVLKALKVGERVTIEYKTK